MGLPGDLRKVFTTYRCETEGHEHRTATHRLQGETDSFGAEYMYLCEECSAKAPRYWYEGTCPRCGSEGELHAYRDPEEGPNGPVYAACPSCRIKIRSSFREDD